MLMFLKNIKMLKDGNGTLETKNNTEDDFVTFKQNQCYEFIETDENSSILIVTSDDNTTHLFKKNDEHKLFIYKDKPVDYHLTILDFDVDPNGQHSILFNCKLSFALNSKLSFSKNRIISVNTLDYQLNERRRKDIIKELHTNCDTIVKKIYKEELKFLDLRNSCWERSVVPFKPSMRK